MGLARSRHLVMETVAVAVDLAFYRAINRDVNRRKKTIPPSDWTDRNGSESKELCSTSGRLCLENTPSSYDDVRVHASAPRLPTKIVEDDAAICRSIIRFEYVARNEATG